MAFFNDFVDLSNMILNFSFCLIVFLNLYLKRRVLAGVRCHGPVVVAAFSDNVADLECWPKIIFN